MGSRDLGLVTIFFSNPRTHRSLRERPARFASAPPPIPRSLASRANYRAARGFEPRTLASLRSNSNCLRIFRGQTNDTTPIIDLRACTLQLCFRDKDLSSELDGNVSTSNWAVGFSSIRRAMSIEMRTLVDQLAHTLDLRSRRY